MFFHFFVEDISGKEMLECILRKLLNPAEDQYAIDHYHGIGKLPKKIKNPADLERHQLLNELPRLLDGKGRVFSGYPKSFCGCVFVICDLDKRDKASFINDLNSCLTKCKYKPETFFCLAIEEGEAWLLGDTAAILQAYPSADRSVLGDYHNDSICDTWELLAKVILGTKEAEKLKKLSYFEIGGKKIEWAKNITPHMVVERNQSPSFNDFIAKIKEKSDTESLRQLEQEENGKTQQ